MREKMYFADCNFSSLSMVHRKMCLDEERYVPPYTRYTDMDSIIHHPAYPTPRHNPDNFEEGEDDDSVYKLDFVPTKRILLEVCHFWNLKEDHLRACFEAGRYVSPTEKYVDEDGITHDPQYSNPRDNGVNSTWFGEYYLDIPEKQRYTDYSCDQP